ncbi:hypothetical protein IIA16_03885 [bacterium]|nr:hypothetical protein [bacterium]
MWSLLWIVGLSVAFSVLEGLAGGVLMVLSLVAFVVWGLAAPVLFFGVVAPVLFFGVIAVSLVGRGRKVRG